MSLSSGMYKGARMIVIHAKLALAAAILLSMLACNQSLPPQPQAAPSPAASLVLEQAQQLQTQQLVPDALAVPAGNVRFRSLIGVGEQLYTCSAQGAGFAWTFVAPRAKLYRFDFREVREVGTHYAGPTWQDSADGSRVVGRVLQSVPAPFSLNGQPAIPWLLLEAASTTSAGNGNAGTFTPATFIRRLFTVDGVAPASGCEASTTGRMLGVPYASLYEFYRAKKP